MLDGMVLARSCQSEVANLSVAGHINKHVLRLQIPVDDAMAVDVRQTFRDLPDIPPRIVLAQIFTYEIT